MFPRLTFKRGHVRLEVLMAVTMNLLTVWWQWLWTYWHSYGGEYEFTDILLAVMNRLTFWWQWLWAYWHLWQWLWTYWHSVVSGYELTDTLMAVDINLHSDGSGYELTDSLRAVAMNLLAFWWQWIWTYWHSDGSGYELTDTLMAVDMNLLTFWWQWLWTYWHSVGSGYEFTIKLGCLLHPFRRNFAAFLQGRRGTFGCPGQANNNKPITGLANVFEGACPNCG